jgi:hypothetical protein
MEFGMSGSSYVPIAQAEAYLHRLCGGFFAVYMSDSLTFLRYSGMMDLLDVLALEGVKLVPRLLDPEIEKRFQERPKAEREVLAGTISHITHVLLEGSPADIVALEGNLRRGQELRSDSVDELEARNKLRVFARYRGIEERSLAGSELRERFGVSRQRLGQLRKEKNLLGVRLPIRREVYYPLWQFDGEGKPLRIMPRLIEAADEAGVSALALDALMTDPEVVDAGGETSAKLLHSGDPAAEEYVLGLVRATLSGGS